MDIPGYNVTTYTRADPEYWIGTTFGATVASLPATSREWTAANTAAKRLPWKSPQRAGLLAATAQTAHLAP